MHTAKNIAAATDTHTAATAYAAGFQSCIDGYTSTGAAPYAVYMNNDLREAWMQGWAAAEENSEAQAMREAGYADRIQGISR